MHETDVVEPEQVQVYPLLAVGDTRLTADGVEYSFFAACSMPARSAAVAEVWEPY